MYNVLITESAREANSTVEARVDEEGERQSFRSKRAVEEFAAEMSECGPRVSVQKVAPQDTREIDAYLVSDPKTHTSTPKEVDGPGLVFDMTANQYGAIGEALVAGEYGVSPGLKYYIEEHADVPIEDGYKITRRKDARVPHSVEYEGIWSPDLIVDVKRVDGWETVETFYCEIKSGNASFERSQRQAMQSLAREHTVLKIRVDLDELPEEYKLLITPVEET